MAMIHPNNGSGTVKAHPVVGDHRYNPITNTTQVFDGQNWIDSPMNRSYISKNAINNGHLTIGNTYHAAAVPAVDDPADGVFKLKSVHSVPKMTFKTKAGDVTANLETGELTMPVGVARDTGLRDFWQAFQEHFKPSTSNDTEIESLKLKLRAFERGETIQREKIEEETKAKLIEKIRNKYGSDKFIMTKPDELIKILES